MVNTNQPSGNNQGKSNPENNILTQLNNAISTYSKTNTDFRTETLSKLRDISGKVNEIMKLKQQIDINENKKHQLNSSDKTDAEMINKLEVENQQLKNGIKTAIDDINNLNMSDTQTNKTTSSFIANLIKDLDVYINNNTKKGGYMYSERGRRKKNTSYKSSARGVLRNNNIENSIELYKNKVRKTKGHKSKGHKQKSRKLKAAGMLNVMRMKQTKYKKTKSKGKNKSKAKKSKSKQNKSKKNKSVKTR